jgi:glutamine cyclotransferase
VSSGCAPSVSSGDTPSRAVASTVAAPTTTPTAPATSAPPIPTVTTAPAAATAASTQVTYLPFVSDDLPGTTPPQPTPDETSPPPETTPVYTYTVVATYPHDPGAFTQGLVYHEGVLYEGTGEYGTSTLRKVDLATGNVLQRHDLAPDVFGEGIAVYSDTIVQLTWQSNIGYVYEQESFAQRSTFNYPGEGWGLTYDGTRLIMSDGTATLRFLNPTTFEEIGRVEVRDQSTPIWKLNELEYINGEIFANIWQNDRIARIDPATGEVVGWIDLSGLLSSEDRQQPVDVLNGIAYDAAQDRLFVTGKLWSKLFEIDLTLSNE